VWYAVPVEDLLLFLCPNAVILVEEVQETTLWLLERSIGARLEVAQIRKDAFLKLLRVLHRSAKGLESEGETSHNIGPGDVKKVVPVFVNTDNCRPMPTITYHNTQETYSPVGRRKRRMYWSGVQSTGADIKKYLTAWSAMVDCVDGRGRLTIIDLLQCHLSILWQTLLCLTAQHESLWLLWRSHRRMML